MLTASRRPYRRVTNAWQMPPVWGGGGGGGGAHLELTKHRNSYEFLLSNNLSVQALFEMAAVCYVQWATHSSKPQNLLDP